MLRYSVQCREWLVQLQAQKEERKETQNESARQIVTRLSMRKKYNKLNNVNCRHPNVNGMECVMRVSTMKFVAMPSIGYICSKITVYANASLVECSDIYVGRHLSWASTRHAVMAKDWRPGHKHRNTHQSVSQCTPTKLIGRKGEERRTCTHEESLAFFERPRLSSFVEG